VLGGLNVLGFLYDFRKVFGYAALFMVVILLMWYVLHVFHLKPISELKEQVASVELELRKCEERAVERFETQNRSVFDVYRERIEEIEHEEIVVDEFNSSDYDWMYQ
jgi:hypothetical protein